MINIIVAFPKMENAKNIKSILVKNGFRVNAVCTSGAQVLQHADMLEEGIIVCAGRLQDMMYIQLREYLSPHFQMLVVASAGLWEAEKSENVVSLTMPLKVHELVGTLEMMANSLMRRRRKKSQGSPDGAQQYDGRGSAPLYAKKQHGQRNESCGDSADDSQYISVMAKIITYLSFMYNYRK